MEAEHCPYAHRCYTQARLQPTVDEALGAIVSGKEIGTVLLKNLTLFAFASERTMPDPADCNDCPRIVGVRL